MSKEPIVRLISFTPQPVELMLYVFKNMLGTVPENFKAYAAEERNKGHTRKLMEDFMYYLACEPLTGGVQEFVSTVWYLGNVSRAFQQQLTRHRTAAYCIQSLRIHDKRDFAEKQEYLVPDDVKDPLLYRGAMLTIQMVYNTLLDGGEKTQVARGVLPLNIYSPITMVVNLRNLRELICTRLCNKVQGEFKIVAEMMVKEVCEKMGEEFRGLFKRSCERLGFCPHGDGCGLSPPKEKEPMTDSIKRFLKGGKSE